MSYFRTPTNVDGLMTGKSTGRGPSGRDRDFTRILRPRLPRAIPMRTVQALPILPKPTIYLWSF